VISTRANVLTQNVVDKGSYIIPRARKCYCPLLTSPPLQVDVHHTCSTITLQPFYHARFTVTVSLLIGYFQLRRARTVTIVWYRYELRYACQVLSYISYALAIQVFRCPGVTRNQLRAAEALSGFRRRESRGGVQHVDCGWRLEYCLVRKSDETGLFRAVLYCSTSNWYYYSCAVSRFQARWMILTMTAHHPARWR